MYVARSTKPATSQISPANHLQNEAQPWLGKASEEVASSV